MKAKRRLSMVLVLALCASAITGCGSGGTKPAESAPKAPAESTAPAPSGDGASGEGGEEVNLTFVLGVTDNYLEDEEMYIISQAYMKEHPNVKIEFTTITTSGGSYTDKTSVMLAGGDTSDLFTAQHMPHYLNLINNGYINELNSYIDRDQVDMNVLYHGAEKNLEFEGTMYSMPYAMNLWLVWFNKDMFDARGVEYPKNGMTWDEWAELCKQMTYGEGAEKVYGGYLQDWRASVNNIPISSGERTLADFDNYKWMMPSYEMAMELQEGGYIMDYATINTNKLMYDSVFANQQCAMFYQGTWTLNSLVTRDKHEGLGFRWGVVQGPYLTEGGQAGDVVGTVNPLCMNAAGLKKDATWDLIKYITTSPESAKLMIGAGSLPVHADQEAWQGLLELYNFPEDALGAFEFGRFSLEIPMTPYAAEIEEYCNEAHSLIMTKSMGIEEAIAQLSERLALYRDAA